MKKCFFSVLFVVLSLYPLHAATEVALKLNGAYALLGIVNPAIEVEVHPHATMQLDVVASFYQSIQGMPLLLTIGYLEGRYYPKEAFDGFYVAPTVGYGTYKLQKYNYRGTTKVQYGTSTFLGATIGYQWQVKRFQFDLFLGGGYQYGIYEGIDSATGERYDEGTYPGKYNISAEWIPFKGGVMIGYRF